MVVSGLTMLAMVCPWRPDPPEPDPSEEDGQAMPVQDRLSPPPGPNRSLPRPGYSRPASSEPKRHRVEVISRARRAPAELARKEIQLPEWLGPTSGPSRPAS
jgi:hypothetical protein